MYVSGRGHVASYIALTWVNRLARAAVGLLLKPYLLYPAIKGSSPVGDASEHYAFQAVDSWLSSLFTTSAVFGLLSVRSWSDYVLLSAGWQVVSRSPHTISIGREQQQALGHCRQRQ